MRFEVPQFIDIEDKVFGPLTFKQFVYLAGGGGLSFIVWTFVPKLLGIPLIFGIIALSVALAFYKFNNKPFVDFLEAAFRYVLSRKLYLWKKLPPKVEKQNTPASVATGVGVPRLSDSRLRDLAWSLDVHDSLYGGTEEARSARP